MHSKFLITMLMFASIFACKNRNRRPDSGLSEVEMEEGLNSAGKTNAAFVTFFKLDPIISELQWIFENQIKIGASANASALNIVGDNGVIGTAKMDGELNYKLKLTPDDSPREWRAVIDSTLQGKVNLTGKIDKAKAGKQVTVGDIRMVDTLDATTKINVAFDGSTITFPQSGLNTTRIANNDATTLNFYGIFPNLFPKALQSFRERVGDKLKTSLQKAMRSGVDQANNKFVQWQQTNLPLILGPINEQIDREVRRIKAKIGKESANIQLFSTAGRGYFGAKVIGLTESLDVRNTQMAQSQNGQTATFGFYISTNSIEAELNELLGRAASKVNQLDIKKALSVFCSEKTTLFFCNLARQEEIDPIIDKLLSIAILNISPKIKITAMESRFMVTLEGQLQFSDPNFAFLAKKDLSFKLNASYEAAASKSVLQRKEGSLALVYPSTINVSTEVPEKSVCQYVATEGSDDIDNWDVDATQECQVAAENRPDVKFTTTAIASILPKIIPLPGLPLTIELGAEQFIFNTESADFSTDVALNNNGKKATIRGNYQFSGPQSKGLFPLNLYINPSFVKFENGWIGAAWNVSTRLPRCDGEQLFAMCITSENQCQFNITKSKSISCKKANSYLKEINML